MKKRKLLQQNYKDTCAQTDTHAFIYSGRVLLPENRF